MFELTDDVLEQIIFAMEDQENDYLIETNTGEVLKVKECPETELDEEPPEYESIPTWTSRDGFALMDRFADSLSDPTVREELKSALARGRGVFRSFKNVLDRDRVVEERWYEFKKAAMRKAIAAWYDTIRDARGLARLGAEPEETEDLVLSDYTLARYGAEARRRYASLFQASLRDALERFPEPVVEFEYTRMESEIAEGDPETIRVVTAENAAGEAEAVVLARTVFVADRSFCRLLFLYVVPERRGLGLGKTLVEAISQWCHEDGIVHLIVDLPFLGEGFGKSLERSGYVPFGARYIISSGD